MNQESIGIKIATLRKEKHMTQKELAEQLHVTDKAVSKWERGMNYPDLALFSSLAKVLETSVADLLELKQNTSDHDLDIISEIAKAEQKQTLIRLREYLYLTIVLGIGVILFKLYLSTHGYVWEKYNFVFWVEAILFGVSATLITNGFVFLSKLKKYFS